MWTWVEAEANKFLPNWLTLSSRRITWEKVPRKMNSQGLEGATTFRNKSIDTNHQRQQTESNLWSLQMQGLSERLESENVLLCLKIKEDIKRVTISNDHANSKKIQTLSRNEKHGILIQKRNRVTDTADKVQLKRELGNHTIATKKWHRTEKKPESEIQTGMTVGKTHKHLNGNPEPKNQQVIILT